MNTSDRALTTDNTDFTDERHSYAFCLSVKSVESVVNVPRLRQSRWLRVCCSQTLAARLFVAGVLLASAGSALAAVRYVDVNSASNTSPYTSWATAATNIQDAVDAAVSGDEIVVTNGIYARVAVGKPLTLRSLSGSQSTIIDGRGSNRCVSLVSGASLSGFILTNGVATGSYGGGVLCESATAVISNCVLTGNRASSGGGVSGGTLNNCTLSGNSASWYCCFWGGYGGGAVGSTLNNCTLTGNSATGYLSLIFFGGGGGAASSVLNNCLLNGNQAFGGIGGGGAFSSALNNCLLTGNLGWGALGGTLNNCTVTGNSGGGASGYYGGDGEGGIQLFPVTLNNCIVYFNGAADGANYDSSSTVNYSCTTPQPTNGVGNITNAPLFVDLGSGNLRLQSDSACINAGNNTYAAGVTDLDGNARIAGDSIDMGAYEFQSPPSIAPRLTITSSGTHVILAWPTNYGGFIYEGHTYPGFTLLSTTNLVSPMVWTAVSPGPVIVNGRLVVTNLVSGTQRFYTLSRPSCWPAPPGCCFMCLNGVWTKYINCRGEGF